MAELLFERYIPRVAVFQLRDIGDLTHPTLGSLLREVGMPLSLFRSLLHRDPKLPVERHYPETLLNSEGEVYDEVDVWNYRTPQGDIVEVSDSRMNGFFLKDRDPFINLHTEGFEALYVMEGRMGIYFPIYVTKEGTEEGTVYKASLERKSMQIGSNNLVVVCAPAAMGISDVNGTLVSRYICRPPYSEEIIREVAAS